MTRAWSLLGGLAGGLLLAGRRPGLVDPAQGVPEQQGPVLTERTVLSGRLLLGEADVGLADRNADSALGHDPPPAAGCGNRSRRAHTASKRGAAHEKTEGVIGGDKVYRVGGLTC